MTNIDNKYDSIGEFHEGVAIVVKNGKYGAIMVGGKEIFPPIYDAFTDFENGLAKVKYEGKNRIVNLSGQVQVKKGKEYVFLPEEYDWGFDFIKGLCVVLKNERYGIIDNDFKCIVEPQYISFEGFHKGYAFFQKDSTKPHDVSLDPIELENANLFPSEKRKIKYDVLDTEGNVVFMDVTRLDNGYCIVTTPLAIQKCEESYISWERQLYGLVDNNFNIIYPIENRFIEEISCRCYNSTLSNRFFKISKTKYGTIFNQRGVEFFDLKENESILNVLQVGEIVVFKTKRFLYSGIIYKLYIYDSKGVEMFTLDDDIQLLGYKCILLQSIYGTIFRIDFGGIWLADLQYKEIKHGTGINVKNRKKFNRELIRKIDVFSRVDNLVKVNKDYFNYEYTYFNDKFFLVEDKKSLCKGLADNSGKVTVDCQFLEIVYIDKEEFIGVKLLREGYAKYAYYGVFNSANQEVLPFEYNFLEKLDEHRLLYSHGDHRKVEKKLLTEGHYYYSLQGNVGVQGLMDLSYNVLCPPKYYSIKKFIDSDFYIVQGGTSKCLYGIINSYGIEIVPPKFNKIERFESQYTIADVYMLFSENGILKEYHQKVNREGDFVLTVNSGNLLYISAHQYDWCDNFNDVGWAKVTKNGLSGKINSKGILISVFEDKLLEVPDCYDWAYDFHHGFVSVNKDGKWGVANTNFDLVIPCEYEDIEAISTKRFKIRKGDKWGIIDEQLKTISTSEYERISHIAKKYFKVHIHINSVLAPRYGIIDEDGHVIIPAECVDINMVSVGATLFWIVNIGKKGVCNEEGEVIIPFIYDNVDLSDDLFICEIYEQRNSSSSVSRNIKFSNIYTKNGEQRLCIDNTFNIDVPKEYDIACYAGFGLIRVMNKEGEWGLINLMNDVIIAPQFSYIDVFDGTFAVVGNSEDSEVIMFPDKDGWHVNMKYGLIDVFGDIVLPIEYAYIDKWDNGYYYLTKRDGHRTLLSSTLHTIIETSKELVKLDNNYIKVVGESANYGINMFGLMDFNGNVIIPTDDEHNFTEIEVLKNGFLKIIYYKGDRGNSHIGILDNRGKIIYDNDYCDDIRLLDNGFILVESERQILLLNLQGKCVLKKWYNKINFVSNGLLALRDSDGWGLADIKGHLIIDTHYLDELVFEDNVSDIRVKGSSLTQKINEKGIVIVHNGKNEIELPESVYWGTDYVNGLSIVRRKVNECHVISVVDIKGNMIIPAQYKSVTLLSDNTIRVMDGDCYGLFDLNGKTILPPIFTDIKYIAKDRILVEWNLNIAKEWDNTGYIPGNSYTKYKGSDGDLDYRACNRSALCNSKGEIINDKELSYVENFVNNYAKAYKKIVKEKNKLNTKIEVIEVDAIKYRQVGVIDLSGNTIVQPIYDSIVLYKESLYVKVCKDEKYGIIHLPSKSIKMYDDVPIKHMWDVDALGRCVYSEDCEYDDDSDDWNGGTRGVLNPQGVLVPPGKYTDIYLIDNGLIEVSNDDGNLYGLLDKEGKEILPIKYTYISSFKGNFAAICIGGEKDYNSYRLIKGGKWGVIDNTGKIIKECVCDEEEVLKEKECDYNETDNEKTFIGPSVILSDSIPEPKERNSYDYYDSYRDDYDEGPHSKYGGYNGWDDDTIDEAFDGNPELTWNID